MKYTVKNTPTSSKTFVVEDMLLTKNSKTSAGSKMLENYESLFEAEVITRLSQAGYELLGKTNVGEFGIDLMGETSYFGAEYDGDKLVSALALAIKDGDTSTGLSLDTNGATRRASAQAGLVSIKPTYGTVSRYGVIAAACSGDTVSITADSAEKCKEVLSVIAGHDDKDGTSLSCEVIADMLASNSQVKKVAVLSSFLTSINAEVKAKMDETIDKLKANGVEVEVIDDSIIEKSSIAWNVLMSAELCNNVSRYDGVKYGYRAQNFNGIDELYTNSRTESFGFMLKSTILFGSETLSTANYMKVYDKCLRTRRVIVEEFAKIFSSFDAVLIPACSSFAYTKQEVENDIYKAFTENFYTAPASITGLPAVVANGVQFVGKAFSDISLLSLATSIEKEGK